MGTGTNIVTKMILGLAGGVLLGALAALWLKGKLLPSQPESGLGVTLATDTAGPKQPWAPPDEADRTDARSGSQEFGGVRVRVRRVWLSRNFESDRKFLETPSPLLKLEIEYQAVAAGG